jgi:hypothetical protein
MVVSINSEDLSGQETKYYWPPAKQNKNPSVHRKTFSAKFQAKRLLEEPKVVYRHIDIDPGGTQSDIQHSPLDKENCCANDYSSHCYRPAPSKGHLNPTTVQSGAVLQESGSKYEPPPSHGCEQPQHAASSAAVPLTSTDSALISYRLVLFPISVNEPVENAKTSGSLSIQLVKAIACSPSAQAAFVQNVNDRHT